jgi:alpha-beta hydrolase superfamily lysophospholipase
MSENELDGFALLDRHEVLSRLFYPRKELPEIPVTARAMTFFITVDEGISIGCRFYPINKEATTIFYFHGNGEIASDYDYVAPLYNEINSNLFVADYRGYGLSTGEPTATAL